MNGSVFVVFVILVIIYDGSIDCFFGVIGFSVVGFVV